MASKRIIDTRDNSWKVVVALPDIHYPMHDERSLACVEKFMDDIKPTNVVYLGDALQMDCFSHWIEDKRRTLEGQRAIKDYTGFRCILDRHKSLAPNAHFTYIFGNHEDWAQQYVDTHPQMEGLLEVDSSLHLRERDIEVVPFGEAYKIGKLTYIHGVYTNDHHAKSTVLAFQRNVRYGHTHDIQSYTWVSPIDIQHRFTATSIGCLCNVNPIFLKHKPNKWLHGFNVAYVRPDGTFTDYTISIYGGKFIYGGKEYKA